MLGAIIGDIVGSVYEHGSDKTKDFPFFSPDCTVTDDSILTIAVGCACVSACLYDERDFKNTLISMMREIGRQYPDAGYGRNFYYWLMDDNAAPYGGNTNGSAMRVSPVAWAADSLEEAERLAKWSAEITHNDPEGIRGAQAVAAAVYLARTGSSIPEIRAYIEESYYPLDFTLDEIRPGYSSFLTCDKSVPQAIMCFLESTDYEDAVRNAISLGGDCDTMGCIAGAIAEAFYGIPPETETQAFDYIDETLQDYYFGYSEALYKS